MYSVTFPSCNDARTEPLNIRHPRCPMECRLTHSSGPWQCQVLLRRETDEHGRKIPTKEEKFGPLLYDKSELEEMIRRAQLAILNPSVPKDVFETFDTKSLKQGEKPAESIKQLAFSSNVVCLDLSAPDVTDLSFIDLPGKILPLVSLHKTHIVDSHVLRHHLECSKRRGPRKHRSCPEHGRGTHQGQYPYSFDHHYAGCVMFIRLWRRAAYSS